MSRGLIIPVFIAHQGCPHQCLFCNQKAIAGSEPDSTAAAGDIAATIATWLERSPGHAWVEVAFYGGSFTCLPRHEQQRLLAQVEPFIIRGTVQSVRLSTRPDCVTVDNGAMLASYGVKTVELGVQSLDDDVLQKTQRGHTAEDSRRAIAMLKEQGFKVGVQLLPGLPGESTVSFLQGVNEVVSLRPDLVRLYPAVVVAGSELADWYRQGWYRPLSLNRAIALVHRALERFEAAAIPVIRMGLQPAATLDDQVVAGPYHPAFGELVRSRGWFRKVRSRLAHLEAGASLEIYISHRDYSALAGMRRINLERLNRLGFGGRYKIVTETTRERGSVRYVVSK